MVNINQTKKPKTINKNIKMKISKKIINDPNDDNENNENNNKVKKIPSVFIKKNIIPSDNMVIYDLKGPTGPSGNIGFKGSTGPSGNIGNDGKNEVPKSNESEANGTLMVDAENKNSSGPNASPKLSPKSSPWSGDKNNDSWGDEEIIETGDVEINTEDDNYPEEGEIVDDAQTNNEEIDKNMLINGITYDEFKKLPYKQQNQFGQCTYCLKFYNKNISPKMITTEFADGEPTCFHCIFWMNYDMNTRSNVDGVYGMTILEYVMECKDVHDKSSCTRNSVAGGCFVCDYFNKVPFVNVIGGETLYDNYQDECGETEDDYDYLQTVDYSFEITI